MAKQIILLDTTAKGRLRVAFWLAVPAPRQSFYANAAATSQYSGADATELAALRTGVVTEQVAEFPVASLTVLQMRTMLQAEFTARQQQVTNGNPWQRYGTVWDGTTWTTGGVA